MRKREKKMNPKKEYKVRLFILTSVLITAVCIIYGLIVYGLGDKGVFGDMFGALTAWFSGLAFAGIIYTILQQKTELEYQREELKLTRQEFATQNETLKKQRFENTYFNLLSQHNKTIDGLSLQENKQTKPNDFKYDTFRHAHSILTSIAATEIMLFKSKMGRSETTPDPTTLSETETEEVLNQIVSKWYNNSSHHNLYLYFQSLKRILKFIDRSSLLDSFEERLFYASLLKDQISYYEKAIILYTGLLPDSWYKGITYYIKTYKLLDGIDERSLITNRDKRIFDRFANSNKPTD